MNCTSHAMPCPKFLNGHLIHPFGGMCHKNRWDIHLGGCIRYSIYHVWTYLGLPWIKEDIGMIWGGLLHLEQLTHGFLELFLRVHPLLGHFQPWFVGTFALETHVSISLNNLWRFLGDPPTWRPLEARNCTFDSTSSLIDGDFHLSWILLTWIFVHVVWPPHFIVFFD
jgi:hypothetical protein